MVDVSRLIKRGIPQVNPNRPTNRVDPNAAGVGLLGEVINLGGAAADLGISMLNTEAETDAKNADTTLSEKIRIRLYGDGTPQNPGHYNLQGQDALNDRQAVDADIQQYTADAMSSVGTRAQRKLRSAAQRRSSTALTGIAQGGFAAQKKVELGASIAREEESLNMAAAVAGTIDLSTGAPAEAVHVIEVGREAADRARKAGAKPPEVKREKAAALTKAHTAVINALLGQEDGGAKKAEDYFNKHLVEIDGGVRKGLKDKIDTVDVVQSSQVQSDTIMGVYHKSGKNQGDGRHAMKTARAITDPKLRDATVRRVSVQIAEDEAFKKGEQRDLRLSGYGKLQSVPPGKLTVQEIDALGQTVGGSAAVADNGRKLADIKAGRMSEPDQDWEIKMTKMAASDKDLAAYLETLATDDAVSKLGKRWSYWVNESKAARERLATGVDQGRTAAKIRADAIDDVGKPNTSEFNIRFDQLSKEAAKGLSKGQKVSSTDLQTIADKLTLKMRRERPSEIRAGAKKITGIGAAFGIPEFATMFKIDPSRVDSFDVENTEENHDNIARIFKIPKHLAPTVLHNTKKEYGSTTLENIGRAVKIMKDKAADRQASPVETETL